MCVSDLQWLDVMIFFSLYDSEKVLPIQHFEGWVFPRHSVLRSRIAVNQPCDHAGVWLLF